MATTINQVYLGDLRVEATHDPSSVTLVSDAPKDHDGLGRSFAPTDLLATALGNAALTAMSIAAEHNGWDMKGTSAITRKFIAEVPPRRVDLVDIIITFPDTITPYQAYVLENVAYTNPVYLSVCDSMTVHHTFTLNSHD